MNYPYACRIDIRFPTHQQAEQTMQVLQVDREPGDRVVKTFSLAKTNESGSEGADVVVMRW